MIKIGSYILDQEEMTLSCDDDSIKLEPKVLEVLTYFYQNENRYISIAELHENVWQDRCVSDAAVRRAIGKLRTLFNDDHKTPKYIQSLPKRGYKLICQTSEMDGDSKSIANSNSSKTKQLSLNNPHVLLEKLLHWGNKTVMLLFVFIIVLFFIGPLMYRLADIS